MRLEYGENIKENFKSKKKINKTDIYIPVCVNL